MQNILKVTTVIFFGVVDDDRTPAMTQAISKKYLLIEEEAFI